MNTDMEGIGILKRSHGFDMVDPYTETRRRTTTLVVLPLLVDGTSSRSNVLIGIWRSFSFPWIDTTSPLWELHSPAFIQGPAATQDIGMQLVQSCNVSLRAARRLTALPLLFWRS